MTLRRFLRDSSWLIGQVGITTPLLFLETVLLARYLGAYGLGVYSLIIAFPETVLAVLTFRTRDAVTKYVGEFVAGNDSKAACATVRLIWVVDTCVGALAFLIIVLASTLATEVVIQDPQYAWLVSLYGFGLFVGMATASGGSLLRVFGRFRLSALLGTSAGVLRFAGVFAALVAGTGLNGAVVARVAADAFSALLLAVFSWGVLRHELGFTVRGGVAAVRSRTRDIARFLFHTNIASTFRLASDKIVILLLGVVVGPAATGLYKVALQLGTAVLLLADPLYVVAYPEIAQSIGSDRYGGIHRTLVRLSKWLVALAVALALLSLLLMRPAVVLVFGAEFADAAPMAVVILIGTLPAMVLFWIRAVLLSQARTGELMAISAGTSLVSVVGVPLLASTVGLLSAAGVAGATRALETGLQVWRYLRPSAPSGTSHPRRT